MNMFSEFDYILTDLDGTLIKMDEIRFADEYFKLLSEYVKNFIDPRNIFPVVMSCIEEITRNPDGFTDNYERFLKVLIGKLNLENRKVELKATFDKFYKEEFPKLSHLTKPNQELVKILRDLRKENKNLVLATNPVFPKIAIFERLRWSGMKPDEFALITYMENSKYCKPDVKYFMEICDKLSTSPEKCVMIGNDSQYDSSCEKIGVKYVDVRELI